MAHLLHDSESHERRTIAFGRATGDAPPVELSDVGLQVLERAEADREIIELRFQEYLAHREIEELFASGDLTCLGA